MARYLTHYWKNDSWQADQERGGDLNHTASNMFRERKIEQGDAVYPVTSIKGELYIAGRIVVDQVVSQREAQRILATTDIWEAKDHIVGKRNEVHPVRSIHVPRKLADDRRIE